MPQKFTQLELEAYLDEALAAAEMADLEKLLREQPDLVDQLAQINARREAGFHSLGGIWRKHRLSCPSREQLGSYLLGAMPKAHREYIRFHLEVVACRYCAASLEDLQARQKESSQEASTRRARYFQTSAGYLKKK